MWTYGLSVGHTGMTELTVAFRKFSDTSENVNDKFQAVLLLTRLKRINTLFFLQNLLVVRNVIMSTEIKKH
jgi:hypothetical protein